VIGHLKPGVTAGELFDLGKAYLMDNGFTSPRSLTLPDGDTLGHHGHVVIPVHDVNGTVASTQLARDGKGERACNCRVTLGPVTGRLLARRIATGELVAPLQPFDPLR
jgi:hypothetical protein